ncbi:MAG: efflux RND transporter periplasmic adaptor subunit [Steroidobacteraceae bacterium]
MPIHDHEPSARGSAFVWGGLGLGLLFLAAILTKGFGLLGGSGKGAAEAESMVRQGEKILVPEGSALRARLGVMAAQLQPVSPKLVLPGIVESDPARTAAVLTPLSGRLIALKVGLGDRVTQGQVLATIDSPDLGQAYDDDEKAADTLKLTEKNLGRQEAQNKLGVASDRDLDQAKSDHTQAAAEYARTQARLKMLGVALEKKLSRSLLTVAAPMDGSITTLSATPGGIINDPTQPLMTVADLSTIWVTALVPEKDVAALARNQDAEVALLAYPDKVLHGKVLFVSDVIEPDSRRDKVRIAFANRDYALKPNMFATVTLMGPKRSQIVLPSSALLMNNDRTSVFVATAPWTFERRIVDPLLEEGPSVAILSGVSAGEQVVIKGGILLND